MTNSLASGGFREFVLWLLRRRRRLRVAGDSMQPLLQPGEEVLIDPYAYRRATPQPGDLVVAQHPRRAELRLIKRVGAVTEDDHYFLQGDNPLFSTDSRSFGPVPINHILGRVTSRF